MSSTIIEVLTSACKRTEVPKNNEIGGGGQRVIFAKVTDFDSKGNTRGIWKASISPKAMEVGERGERATRSLCYSIGWVLNNESDVCMRCSSSFGTLKRKHHCRICGYLICSACCAKKAVKIPSLVKAGIETQGSKVCTKICSNFTEEEISMATSFDMGRRSVLQSVFKSVDEEVDASTFDVDSLPDSPETRVSLSFSRSPVKSLQGDAGEVARAELELELMEEVSHLRGRLERGMLVIKHGRAGEPKRRLLKCDHEVTKLFCLSASAQPQTAGAKAGAGEEEDPAKTITVSDILDVRLGTEEELREQVRVEAEDAAGEADGSEKDKRARTPSWASAEQLSSVKPAFLGALFGSRDQSGPLYGTPTLRRKLGNNPDKLALCLSLLLAHRTFDIQCLSQADYDFLSLHLRQLHEIQVALSQSDDAF